MDKKVGNLHLTDSIWFIRMCFSAMSISTLLAANSQLQIPPNVTCACPNEVLTFICTTVGSGATIWGGSAFQCTTGEIILRHNAFNGDTPQLGDCNDIIGESVGVQDNNCYTSQVRVPISAGLDNKTVHCVYNSNIMTLIDETQISVVTGPYQQAPTGVKITNIKSRELNVSWMPLDTNCPSIDYSINFPCATCHITTETTAICSDLQLPSECTLSIQSVICGYVGVVSDQVRVILRVPDKPDVNITPIYSADTRTLTGLRATINQEISFNITNGISGSVTSYNIVYSQTTKNFFRNSSCVIGSCEYVVDVPTTDCSLSHGILNVILSASNILGQGPPSNPMTIGCKNQFVQVNYNMTTSAIVCKFLNEIDISVKLCAVMYGRCGEVLAYTTQENSTLESPNRIALRVDPGSLDCYVVTASSDTATVIVEGKRATGRSHNNIAAIVTPIIGIFFIAITVAIVVVVLVVVIRRRRKKSGHLELESDDLSNQHKIALTPIDSEKQKIITELNLQPVDKTMYTVFTVAKDYELRELVKMELGHDYKRGYAFYEFQHDFESISDDKRLLFMDEENELFSPGIDVEGLRKHQLIGNMVNRPRYKGFKVFVQSTGLGTRHLKGDTMILYQRQDHSRQKKCPTHLWPIVSNHFIKTTIQSETTIKAFRAKNKLTANRCNVFLELNSTTPKISVIDVILMDTENTAELSLYSGPFARNIVKQTSDCSNWRVFVLCKFDKNMKLKAGTEVLHQNPRCTSEEFYELTVEEDNVRLSTFIKQKGYKFINGLAFYEFTDKEDLHCYKEIVYAFQKDQKFKSSIDEFYAIDGAPGIELSPPPIKLKGGRVFLQSTSQGSRCLKKGTTLLYKKDPRVQPSVVDSLMQSIGLR